MLLHKISVNKASWTVWLNWQSAFFSFLFFNIYNVVLVSAIQQLKSTIIIDICPPSWASFLSPQRTPIGDHGVPDWAPCVIQQLLTSSPFSHMIVYICWCYFSPFVPSPSPTVSTWLWFNRVKVPSIVTENGRCSPNIEGANGNQ